MTTVTRRTLLGAAGAGTALAVMPAKASSPGAGYVGTSVPGEAADICDLPLGSGGRKPVALPPAGSTDVAEHSKSDVLFWSDQLSEHGLFFAMLLPGAEAKQLRVFRSIATMDPKAPLPSLGAQTPKWKQAAALAARWELNQLAKRLEELAGEESAAA